MRILSGLVFCAVAGPVWAQEPVCDEWWFTRNLIMDRAGYCFSSPLGQAVFDNADCSTSSPDVSVTDSEIVARIRENEREFGCAVDTSQSRLSDFDEAQQEARRGMAVLPVASGYGSACIGWRGAPLMLRAEPEEGAAVTGQIPTGGDIEYLYDPMGEWVFINSGKVQGSGWLKEPDTAPPACEMYAG